MYELRGYLDNWLETVEVHDFKSLKELLLTEQVKQIFSFENKDKFLDEWDEVNIAPYLAEKCDKYEIVK